MHVPHVHMEVGMGTSVGVGVGAGVRGRGVPAHSPVQCVQGVALFLQTFGEQEKLTDEEYLDMATALSGTGPAYFFLLIETLVDAGVHMGFPRNTAEKLVRQTALGSSMYASKFHHIHPTQLRNDITSPGGTTAAALYAAERGNFRNVVTDAVWAAYERSKILGEASNSIVTSGHTHNNKPK